MQCPVCHNEADSQSAFCNHCGASLTAAAPAAVPAAAPYTPPPASSAPPVAASSGGLTPNSAAAISYITVVPAILFLLIEPYNKMPLVRFHAMQCIGMAVSWFAIWIAIVIVSMLLAVLPGIRLLIILVPFLYAALGLGFFILWIMCILKASKGEWFKLPIIGDFAMKQAQS
jgi:uncharacterized membrane protein